MDPTTALALTSAMLAALLAIAVWAWARSTQRWRARLHDLDHAKRSQSTRYGQITEQFAPFLADWPWDPKQFRFLGAPVDGIQFTPEGVYFIEIKTAGSALSAGQRTVRDHVQAGRVFWHEVRLR